MENFMPHFGQLPGELDLKRMTGVVVNQKAHEKYYRKVGFLINIIFLEFANFSVKVFKDAPFFRTIVEIWPGKGRVTSKNRAAVNVSSAPSPPPGPASKNENVPLPAHPLPWFQ
jgi:hypothetical protein